MSEETQDSELAPAPAVEELDPILTNDLSDVKTTTPLLPEADYDMIVKEIVVKKSQDTDNKYLNIKLATMAEARALSGEMMPAGTVFYGRIIITPTDKRSKDAIERDMKRFQVACGVRQGPLYPVEQYLEKGVRVHLGFSKKSPEYPEDRNEVKRFVEVK